MMLGLKLGRTYMLCTTLKDLMSQGKVWGFGQRRGRENGQSTMVSVEPFVFVSNKVNHVSPTAQTIFGLPDWTDGVSTVSTDGRLKVSRHGKWDTETFRAASW